MTPTDLQLVFPAMFLAVWAMVMLMYGAFTGNARHVAAFTCFGLAMLVIPLLLKPAVGEAFLTGGGPLLTFSPFTNLAQVFMVGLAAVAALLAEPFFTVRKAHKPEFYVLLLLSLAGMFILTTAHDFLTLYMGLELMSFPLYVLTAMLRKDAQSSEAALKYFVLGGLSSGLLLFGVSLVYAGVGTTNFSTLIIALGQGAAPWPLLAVGLALVVVAALFKLSVVPFHMWTPDVYEGAPTPVTAVMAAVPKIAGFVLLVRLLEGPLTGLQELWQPSMAVLALLSMVLGSTVAILQSNLKRLLAWSTIAHVGFMLCGVAAASPQGHGALLFYLLVYGLTTLGLFAALIELDVSAPTGRQPITTVSQLAGLAQYRPLLAAALLVLLFSLAGVPPFGGFFAKLSVFSAAVDAGYAWLAVAGVLASVVAAFYSLWLIKKMYFEPAPADALRPNVQATVWSSSLVLTCLLTVAGVILLGILPNLVSSLTLPAATALF